MAAGMDFVQLFQSFSQQKIGVIGDVMLDTYWWGKVDRISPEAPVPIVAVNKKEQRIGGAGNVALNLRSLGAPVQMISIIGNDPEGIQLTELLREKEIGTEYLIPVDNRPTTNKIRIIGRNQQMMRLDAEITQDIQPDQEQLLLQAFALYLEKEKPALVILEDYNKGVLTAAVIPEVIRLCQANGVLTAVDPKRKNFFAYTGVDIFKPNLQEAREALNRLPEPVNLATMTAVHEALQQQLHHRISLITLSEKGVFYKNESEATIIPTHVRTIADVSGAGDTVIAVAALVYATTQHVRLMAELANLAGGLVCEEVGTVAIDKERLLKEAELIFR
jgi:rfaE bifunctional protein kinase chain/domain